jgi:glycosyltransferase involved in cell wall biosynthesis
MAGSTGSRPPKVALVHDFLLDLRGAERVFGALCDMWPDADVFTPVYNEAGTEGRFADRTIVTSFLQNLRPTSRTFRALLPLYPLAVESFDLHDYDLVISSSSAWAHGVIPAENAVHVCYCHNPFRYAWNARDTTLAQHNALIRMGLGLIFTRWRQWDWIAAQRVDAYLANSQTTRRRIARYFNRDATVVYPPVETGRFTPGEVGDYYLIVSELMPHKRIHVAVEAFNRMGRKLVIVGDGPEARRLRRLAGPTVSIEGRVSDARVAQLAQGCRALVVTATEEFGIAAVEAQAAGRPVIAHASGGARETIVDGVTGTFYERNEPESLVAAVTGFDDGAVDPQACAENAQRFGVARFQRQMRQAVERAFASDRASRAAERGRRRARRRPTRWRRPV